ncbi:MAG: CBS domain-containing protein [Ruminococcaceae bacterium]|nr:CBS domain-containing protein [Oscillospiraceae bacterium]
MTKHVITNNMSLRDALQQMNDCKVKFLVVTDSDNRVVGTLTDGDIRRSILGGNDLGSPVENSVCRNITYLDKEDGLSEAVEAFKDERFEFLPVMDSEKHLINIITRRNLNIMLLKDIIFSTDFDFASLDDIILEHEIFTRPWGFYKTTVLNDMYQSKVIYVMPGQALSLQSHKRREEYWQIVKGTGTIQIGESVHTVYPGASFFIPKGCKHRMTNTSADETLIFTEVQLGDYFGEDDIERYEDRYSRVGK